MVAESKSFTIIALLRWEWHYVENRNEPPYHRAFILNTNEVCGFTSFGHL
jgi:hypothetical protein